MHLHIAPVRTPHCKELITNENYSLAFVLVLREKDPFSYSRKNYIHKVSKVTIVGSVSETFCLQVLVSHVLTEKKGSLRTVLVS